MKKSISIPVNQGKIRLLIEKIIVVELVILMLLTSVKIDFANDYEGITNLGGTSWEYADSTKEWVVTEYDNGENVGSTGTKCTVYVGEDYSNYQSMNFNQGEGVGNTLYKGYDWSSCTGRNAPPDNFNTDSEQMKALVNAMNFNESIMNQIKNGEVVTILSEPTIRIRNTVTGQIIVATVTELLGVCKQAEKAGVKNGDGIRYVENYAKSIMMKLKEEQPELYKALLKNEDGIGQAVHQEKLYESNKKPTTKPEPEKEPEKDPKPDPEPKPEKEPEEPDPVSRNPLIKIIKGFAPESSKPNSNGKIYNDEFGVPSNPIPVRENLSVQTCTDAIGLVENLGLYTVKYEPYEYTYSVYWEQKEQYEYEYEEKVYDKNGKLVRNPDGTIKTEKKTAIGTRTIDSGVESKKITLSGTANFLRIRNDTNYYTLDSITITSEPLPSHTFNMSPGISFTEWKFSGADDERVSKNSDVYSVSVSGLKNNGEDAHSIAISRLNGLIANASVFDFWTRPIEDKLSIGSTSIVNNGAIKGGYRCSEVAVKKIPDNVLNRSLDSGYPSSGIHNFVSTRPGRGGKSKSDFSFSVNPVRIHTPIYDEMIITSPSTNQLENLEGVTSGYKIVTVGDEFTVTVNIRGLYEYYNGTNTSKKLNLDASKYVKDVIIDCGVCGKSYHSSTHTCPWYNTIQKHDNTEYEIVTTVIAANSGPTGELVGSKNVPDDVYVLKQYGGVHLVGKLYDLEVRTTDDVGWKLKNAEKLAKLPTGEKGDNLITSYKYGIKLGYRAYFDLKTLGTASKDLYLTPKIYYVDKAGKVIDVDLYYRTSNSEYKKLSNNDIEIKMTMNKTQGEVNNKDFSTEKASMLVVDKTIDYNKTLNIGGLKGITLTNQNSVATKYNGVYTWKPSVDQSRRWYGEIYLPSSTIVAKKGATISEIARGKNVYEEGYLLITFENIITRFEDGSTYLEYSMGRDTDGVKFSPNEANELVKPSIMYNEKTDNDKISLKKSITLPNGVVVDNIYPQTDAPIIMYDVSLRANNDYETSGTH